LNTHLGNMTGYELDRWVAPVVGYPGRVLHPGIYCIDRVL
jgi:hypothetical protein